MPRGQSRTPRGDVSLRQRAHETRAVERTRKNHFHRRRLIRTRITRAGRKRFRRARKQQRNIITLECARSRVRVSEFTVIFVLLNSRFRVEKRAMLVMPSVFFNNGPTFRRAVQRVRELFSYRRPPSCDVYHIQQYDITSYGRGHRKHFLSR